MCKRWVVYHVNYGILVVMETTTILILIGAVVPDTCDFCSCGCMVCETCRKGA